MSPVEVLVIFVGGPAAVFAACWLLAIVGSHSGNAPERYKLGTPWESEPLWFVGRPREQVVAHRAVAAIESGSTTAPTGPTVVGGASGTW